MPIIKLTTDQIWLKGTGNASQVWSPTVSGLPAGAIINSVTLTFSSGNTYASPGRTEIFWGSEAVAANRLWYVSQSSGSGGTIDLTGRVKGNGSFSLLFRKTANSAGSQSNVYFSGITITIDYTNPRSTFSLDKTTVEAGTSLGVTINRVDSSYTHKVTFAFGSRSYTATGVGTSTSYTIPVAWLDQIPNAVSGTGTVTVETLNSAGASMGSVSASFTLTAGSGVVPTVGAIKAEAVGGLDGLYIQGYSKCKVTVSGYAAGTGATVASVLITGNGDSTWTATLTSSLLRTAGTVTFTVKVTDSRGREASGTVSITVTAYTDIAITSRTALRCTSDGTVSRVTGKSAKLGVSYTMASAGSNAATVKVYWRLYGASSWTQISGWSSTSGYTAVALKDSLALDKRYEIRFDVADKISMASQTAVIEPGVVYMVWSKVKSSFGLGTYPTAEKQLAIAEDWSLMLGSMDVGKSVLQRTRVRNLLDNSDFRNPVNQRGRTTYNGVATKDEYTIDRWFFSFSGNATLKVGDGYIQKNGHRLFQYLTGVHQYETYTGVVCLSDGTIYVHSGNFASGFGDYGNVFWASWNNGKAFFALEDGLTQPVVWAALYEGSYDASTIPAYQPKGYAEELAECQRYFWRCDNTWFSEGSGYAFSDTQYRVSIVLPQMMRVTPTMISSTGNTTSYGIKIHTAGGANITPNTVTFSMKNNRIALTLTGTFTNGELGVLRLENDYLDFSADL